jgi:hypothetical protein
MRFRSLVLLLALPLLAGCTQPGHQLANTAIESLKQVRAASQIGMTYEQYSTRVIDAKVKVNAALEKLPDDDPLKEDLNATMNCYADGVTIWQMKLQNQKIYIIGEPGSSLTAKYLASSEDLSTDGIKKWANPDALLQSAIAAGDSHLEKAISHTND